MSNAMLKTGLALAATAVMAGPLAGCRGERTDKTPRQFFPDMDQQRKWNPQSEHPFYADGRSGRVPPEYTVAFGVSPIDPRPADEGGLGDQPWALTYIASRDAMVALDDGIYRGVTTGITGEETVLDYIPVEVTRDMIEHGRDMFNIYCVACHGYAGDGKGMVGQRWAYAPANLTSAVYRDRSTEQGKDGHLFDVIRHGLWAPDGANRMPSYGHAVDEMDAWAIVGYIRALQRSRGVAWADLPEADQARLGSPTTPAEPAAAPAADSNSMNGGGS